LRTLIASLIGTSLGLFSVGAQAGSLGTVEGLPFFGQPYPFWFAYHPPVENPCYQLQRIDTPDGPRVTYVFVCGAPVSAKY
jgi:hypothetical protein